jgi:hypothetical protein
MGSPASREGSVNPSDSQRAGPEALARLVLRCRELSTFLDSALPQLPAREETPFLYGQLDDVLQRLQSGLRQLVVEEPAHQGEKGSFLRRLAGRKPREAQPRRSEPLYDLQGNAWTIPVTELVGFLSHSMKSGLLWVNSAQETFVLEFSKGDLVHATSNAPPAAFRLGEILLNEKLLEADELARMLDLAKAADDLLGSYLLRTGRLRHTDLQRALAIQVQQLFHRLMDADNALYRFQEGAQLLRSQSLEVNITHLLLESARKKDEERQKHEAPKASAGVAVAGPAASSTASVPTEPAEEAAEPEPAEPGPGPDEPAVPTTSELFAAILAAPQPTPPAPLPRESRATESEAIESAPTELEVTEIEVIELEVTEPEAIEPEASEIEVILLEASEPEATEPEAIPDVAAETATPEPPPALPSAEPDAVATTGDPAEETTPSA